jgi:DNA-directed RNA polymerase subunit omega
MIKPTTSELMKRVDSTYTLCNLVGKRARQLVEGADPLTECNSTKPVSIAAKEICEGKITYVQIKSVPKKKRSKDTSIFESCS